MCTNARMMLSIQRGPCWAANPSSLYELLSKEGAIEGVVEYDQGKGRGSFVFHDEEVLLYDDHFKTITGMRTELLIGKLCVTTNMDLADADQEDDQR